MSRALALRIIHDLRDASFVAYLAGGCVRDTLLGLDPKDYDVATDAPPDAIASLFRRTNTVGASFGVVLVREGRDVVEVATFRSDGPYTDRRRPDSVRFATAEEDARRRDFTINALFLDPVDDLPLHDRVIDLVGGVADLERRVVRAVGDPDARLREDDLRALRAVRFASRLDFEIEPDTAEAIRRHAGDLVGVSRERIGDEIRRMLTHPTRGRAAGLLASLGLDAPIFGGPAPDDSLTRLEALDARAPLATALGAWALDRGNDPATWRDALCLSNEERDALLGTIDAHRAILQDWADAGVARRKRLASGPWFEGGLALVATIDPARAQAVQGDVQALARTGLAPEPIMTGDLLVRAGYRPGPAFGQALDALYDAQLEGRLTTSDEGLRLARELLGDSGV